MVRGFRHDEATSDAWRTEHDEDGEHDMGDIADEDEARYYDEMRNRHLRQMISRRTPRRPIMPLEVAMAAVAAENGAERFGSHPPIGSVLRWTAPGRGAGVLLTFVAVRVDNGAWYTTINDGKGWTSWSEIVGKVGDNPCSVATGWTEIPAPAPEPQGDDVVAAWASQFRETTSQTEAPEPRFDAEGKDRNGWTRAELGEDPDA